MRLRKRWPVSMKAKYEKYWENLANMNLLLYVALVLDPRNKMHYLNYFLELLHGEDSKEGKKIEDKVEKALVELFNAYKMKMDKSNEKKDTFSSSSSVDGEKLVDLEEGYLKYLEKKRGRGANTSELDVLSWWKLNSKKFSVLSQLARHVLGMPISTVAFESAFSTGGRVIDTYRSSLTPKTAESLICSQDWI
ncbi:putative HAT dimerization domain, ribonuclease H-like superfamily, hAT-like transposase, RNase-H [Helianthus annuus]|nr:putative HAT dimerization domain, ribonuclease H-like superfamily, hAT-like transposase, RNase-H [Helianthus annuus]